MVFDTWGGALTPALYREFSLRYMAEIVGGPQPRARGPARAADPLHQGRRRLARRARRRRCRRARRRLDDRPRGGAAATGDRVALQGNLDPSVLYAPPAAIRDEVGRVLASYGRGHGHVFNFGHGIHPDVLPEHAGAMVAAVHELSPSYHA